LIVITFKQFDFVGECRRQKGFVLIVSQRATFVQFVSRML
jgi:hypothetical protein